MFPLACPRLPQLDPGSGLWAHRQLPLGSFCLDQDLGGDGAQRVRAGGGVPPRPCVGASLSDGRNHWAEKGPGKLWDPRDLSKYCPSLPPTGQFSESERVRWRLGDPLRGC